jgi:diguanylate cyclase (GGDEF)-like protein
MPKPENILSNFIKICILEIDELGKILKVQINSKQKFNPKKAKTIYDLFDSDEHTRIERLLELKISHRKTLIKMNPKYGIRDFAEVEISVQEEKTYIAINFLDDRREKEIEIEKKVEQFVKQAEQDKLTGLLNRTGYWNRVEKTLQCSDPDRQLGIIMFDMDNLKDVNDTKGHLEGDNSIKEVGEIIKDSIRSRDIACRYGGDEFLIIVEELTGRQSTAYGLAKRLRRRISKSKKAQTTISIGVHVVKVGYFSKYLDNKEKLQEKWNKAVKIADEMAYKAKEAGKNRVECSENVNK